MTPTPAWYQVVQFFIVVGPLVAALTFIFSRFFQTREPEPIPAATPYTTRQEWKADVRGGKPLDDVLEKCAGDVPKIKE